MIIVDTNVLSEPLRRQPSPSVVTWLDAQAIETLYLTTIGLAEVRYGIAALPTGKRKVNLAQRFEDEVLPLFRDRVLTFDESAAFAYGKLRAKTRADGRALGDFDALIAAIADSRKFIVATRDVSPFEAAGLTVINPFEM